MYYQSSIYVVSTKADGPVQAFSDKILAEQYAVLYSGSVKKITLRIREVEE
jgi:hypothetical protein